MNHVSFPAFIRWHRLFLAGLFFCFLVGYTLAESGNPYSQAESFKALAELLEKNPPVSISITEPINGTTPVVQSLQALRGQIQKLNLYLKKSGKTGQKWSTILKLPELTNEANRATPDLGKMESYLIPFRSHLWGLEVEPLQETGNCIQDYIGIRILIEDNVDMNEAVQTALPGLIKTLKHADSGSFQSAQELNDFLLWARQYRQMPKVCDQIRTIACRNNLSVSISDQFIYRFTNRPVNRTMPVQETIQGVSQRGTMKTVGTNEFQLIPLEDKIGLKMNFQAVAEGAMTGYAERNVRIQSDATNKIHATKNIYFDGTDFSFTPTEANVEVTSKVTGISAPSNIVQRAAQNRVSEARVAAQREATIKAQRRTQASVDQEVAQLTKQASKQLQSFSLLYKDRGIYPSSLKCVSFSDHVLIEGLVERSFALCVQPRPVFGEDCDLRVSVHQSMLVEFTKGLLADLRANEKTFLLIAQSMLPAKVFARIQDAAKEWREKNTSEEDLAQGYLYFSAQFPLNVEFKDGNILVSLRIDGFQGDPKKKIQDIPMNISVCYKPELSKDEQGRSVIRFSLVDKAKFVPRDFEIQTRSLTKQEITIRNRMGQTVEKLFPKDFTIETSDLMVKKDPADAVATEKIGTMIPVAIDVREGWLQIGWKLAD